MIYLILIIWFLCGVYTLLQCIKLNHIDYLQGLNDSFWDILVISILTIIFFPVWIHLLLMEKKE